MNLEQRFNLPDDLLIIPVTQLSDRERRRIDADDDDVAITRTRGRSSSKVVDATAAELLDSFRSPTTIVEAVAELSERHASDPESTLEAAFPVLERLIRSRMLVPEGSREGETIEPLFERGEEVVGYTVRRCVQCLEDSELYRVKVPEDDQRAALKIARPQAADKLRRVIEREAEILRHLQESDEVRTPRVLSQGELEARAYLAIEWCQGSNPAQLAAKLRRGATPRLQLGELAMAIAEAYAGLHRSGVIHGDVHPGNLLITDNGEAVLLDFGLARMPESDRPALAKSRRGALGFYYEPELARSIRRQNRRVATSFKGEQHVVASLLYYLLSGRHHLDFSADQKEALRQLSQEPPQPFESWQLEPWPGVEDVLLRGLAVKPGDRFPSMDDFADSLRAALASETPQSTPRASEEELSEEQPAEANAASRDREDQASGIRISEENTAKNTTKNTAKELPSAAASAPRRPEAEQSRSQSKEISTSSPTLVESYIRRFDPNGQLFETGLPEPPFSSINYGCAGIAYFLYRISLLRQDPTQLAWAKLWIEKGLDFTDPHTAFYSDRLRLTPRQVGPMALYHTPTGLHCVQGLIARAMGDFQTQMDAAKGFAKAVAEPFDNPDLTLGQAGGLIGYALLADAVPELGQLKRQGAEQLEKLWRPLQDEPPIAEGTSLRYLGIAHGWAGVIYAALRWCRLTGESLPADLPDRLDQLAAMAEPVGDGVRFTYKLGKRSAHRSTSYFDSWCNGTTGMVFLWTLAHEMLGESRYLDLAVASARQVNRASVQLVDLCCGRAGQGYAMLCLHRRTGDVEWLEHARRYARTALHDVVPWRPGTEPPRLYDALYKGPLGAAIFAAELEAPEQAAMPLFESEGWTDAGI